MKSINIIAPNIKNGGGLELLNYLVEYLEDNYINVKVYVYLDSSISMKLTKNREVIYLNKSLQKIKLFYKKINNAIYFGNLPPLRQNINSLVYTHNPYLLMNFNELKKTSTKFFLKYSLQQLYIKLFINNIDTVACQNKVMQTLFYDKYKFNNIKILPFYRLCNNQNNNESDKKYDFCYISLAHPHKNHIRLLDAIEILANKNIKISIALTIEEGHRQLIDKIDEINKRNIVKIINLGLLSKDNVCKLYSQSKCLIFPSLEETFGLALIEAVEMNLNVISSDLKYVYEAISPSMTFNPLDSKDMANKLEDYLNLSESNIIKSKAIVENKINELINTIIKEKNV